MKRSKYTEYPKELKDLIIATLCSEGEVMGTEEEHGFIISSFNVERSFYLSNFLQHKRLGEYVTVQTKRNQFKIKVPAPLFQTIKEQWYEDGEKIFSKNLNPDIFSIDSLILCINLYGIRKLETISIPTNVDKKYIKLMTYCMEHHLKTSVIYENKQIKILDVPGLFHKNFKLLSILDSTHLANFLTNKEKNELTKLFMNERRDSRL